ncbi:MAG: hypothetical protein ACSW8I_10240, partial [bacterium]
MKKVLCPHSKHVDLEESSIHLAIPVPEIVLDCIMLSILHGFHGIPTPETARSSYARHYEAH